MADDRFHFLIPSENVRSSKVKKRGFGMSYPRSDYSKHGLKLRAAKVEVGNSEAKKKDSKFMQDVFLQVETPAKTRIRDHKSKIQNLGFEIVSYSPSISNVAVVRIEKEIFSELDQKLDEYIETPDHTGKSNFSVIENFSTIPVDTKINAEIRESDGKIPVVFNLYSSISSKDKFAINQVIVNELKKFSSDVLQANYVNGSTSIACTLGAEFISTIIGEFGSIKEVQPNLVAVAEGVVATKSLPNPLRIEKPSSNSEICIIDSGIRANAIFKGVVSGTIKHLPAGSVDAHFAHGTFVASRCVFGDNIDSCLSTHVLQPYCKVIDVQTFGVDGSGNKINPTGFHLRNIIETVVIDLHKKVRVYNLSLGFDHSIRDNEHTALAKHLDFLSKEYKVLFIVASGNINSPLGKYPKAHFGSDAARIGSPAESILSLTVGAVCKLEDTNSLSSANELSPFSKIGPGADLGVKPEVVAHGGNLAKNYDRSHDISTYGIFHDGNSLAVNVGTSFSAPLISQYAQRLFDAYPGSDPNLVKALLCHFSKRMNIPSGVAKKEVHCVGFGEPVVEAAKSAGPHNATYIYEGKLDQDNYQHVSFHIPRTFEHGRGKKIKLRIRITLVYDPTVDEDNIMEYSTSRISLALEKLTKSRKKVVASSSPLNYRKPWSPIIRMEKTFTRNFLSGAWSVKLRLFTRGKISPTYLQDYALIVEVIDEKGTTDVHKDIKDEFGKIYKKIRIAA